ncbi:unnamed protein product [Cuscuta epithymum]|uniref:Uncharacterized protein n=1 Tax=Cuscuta epithymum TaxID=186058 RepID=A0AAV0DJ69_9ASTE|nr:unnamed protein product [Cuscuta epithymum]
MKKVTTPRGSELNISDDAATLVDVINVEKMALGGLHVQPLTASNHPARCPIRGGVWRAPR